MNTEDRLIEIEIKLSRQEDTVETLNQVIYQQQKKIDHLEASLLALARRVKESSEASNEGNIANERPPHY
ncbi:MAG: SlyX family protein [Pseudomonadota bacterium]